MKTYSRSQWEEAQAAWLDFSDEWKAVRHQAAMRGILFPPAGDRYDSWEDDHPSQRAILIRAIRETPALLSKCVAWSRSWSEVIAKLTIARDEWRDDLAHADAYDRRRHEDDTPSHREAVMSLGSILGRLEESR